LRRAVEKGEVAESGAEFRVRKVSNTSGTVPAVIGVGAHPSKFAKH